MDALAMPWANARAAHLLAIRRMAPEKVGSDHDGGYITRQDGFMIAHPKSRNIGTFLLPCDTREDGGGIHGRSSYHNGRGSAHPG